MDPYFNDYFDHLKRLHTGIEQVLDELPQEALDWVPGEGMNSLAVLAVHVAGGERFWLGDIVARESSGRDRDAEFITHGLDAGQLKERLSASLAYSQGVLDGLSLSDLQTMRVSPRDGSEFSVSWSMAHALEHAAMHLGHMQVTRQVWEQGQI